MAINYDLLDYTIKSTKRYVTKNKRNYQFEAVFLKHIKKMIKINQKEQTSDVFNNFKKDLLVVLEDPYENVALEYFNFISWIDSKNLKREQC